MGYEITNSLVYRFSISSPAPLRIELMDTLVSYLPRTVGLMYVDNVFQEKSVFSGTMCHVVSPYTNFV